MRCSPPRPAARSAQDSGAGEVGCGASAARGGAAGPELQLRVGAGRHLESRPGGARAAAWSGGGGRKREGGEAGGDTRGWGSRARRWQQLLCIGASSPRSPAEAPGSAPQARGCRTPEPRSPPCNSRQKWLCAGSDLAEGEGGVSVCLSVCPCGAGPHRCRRPAGQSARHGSARFGSARPRGGSSARETLCGPLRAQGAAASARRAALAPSPPPPPGLFGHQCLFAGLGC